MNKKKKIVFVVTSGIYSDYHIDGIFSNEGLAKEFVEQKSGLEDVNIREWELDRLDFPEGTRYYWVVMDADGKAELNVNYGIYNHDNAVDHNETEYIQTLQGYIGYYTGRRIFCIQTTKGEKAAIKIANERRLQLIAGNKWPVKGEKVR